MTPFHEKQALELLKVEFHAFSRRGPGSGDAFGRACILTGMACLSEKHDADQVRAQIDALAKKALALI